MTSYIILDSQTQSGYVFVHVSIIVWSRQLDWALRTPQQSFVDQNQISESSTNFDFFILHVYSDHYIYFIARLWYARLKKHSHSLSESRFRNFKSDLRIVTIIQHSNHLSASRTLHNHIYLSSKSAFVLCLDDSFNNISSHNFTSQNTQSIFNIYIIISIEESFEILIYFLANRSSFFAMNIYDSRIKRENRLRSFDNVKDWFSKIFTFEKLVVAEFFQNKYDLIECCECHIIWRKTILINQKSDHNFFCELIQEIEQKTERVKRKTERIKETQKRKKEKIQKQIEFEIFVKIRVKKRIESIKQKIKQIIKKKTSKSTSIFIDIDIFDSTLICDILKFDLYSKMINFLQHFQQIQNQNLYLKSDVLDLLFKCFRDFVFAWFNSQSNFIIIQKFDRDLACAFSTISFEFIAKSSIFTSNFSSQYHLCVECFVQFSSMTRLLEHTKQINCSKMICKHCEQDFNFKNKLHEHIREQHIQKSNLRISTSEFMYKIKKKYYDTRSN